MLFYDVALGEQQLIKPLGFVQFIPSTSGHKMGLLKIF